MLLKFNQLKISPLFLLTHKCSAICTSKCLTTGNYGQNRVKEARFLTEPYCSAGHCYIPFRIWAESAMPDFLSRTLSILDQNTGKILVPSIAFKVLQYTGGHDLFSIGRRRSQAVSTADIPLVSQGAFFQHIHASEPEH